jgi:uncharacterized membrane-anchored protein
VLFGVLIVLPGLAHWKLGLNSVAAFWSSYVLTRPVGASFVDWVDKPHDLNGLNGGNGPAALACFGAVALLVIYLGLRRPDIQSGVDAFEV